MKKLIMIFVFLPFLIYGQSLFLFDDKAIETPPQNIIATGGTTQVTLDWTEITAPDLYGYVIYRDSLGDNVITNGTFDIDASWIKEAGWTIGGDVASGNITGDSYLYQEKLTSSRIWDITFTVTAYTSGSVNVIAGNMGGTNRTATGTYREIITKSPSDMNMNVGFRGTHFIGSVDNISAKDFVISTSHPDIPIDTVLAGTETFINTGLAAGTTYNYRIKALDIYGYLSGYSTNAYAVPTAMVEWLSPSSAICMKTFWYEKSMRVK